MRSLIFYNKLLIYIFESNYMTIDYYDNDKNTLLSAPPKFSEDV